MLKRCSKETLRYRFLRIIKEISEKLLDSFPPVDGVQHVAIAVTPMDNDQRICAVGRYIANKKRKGLAEISFLVEDAMQERGIGTILLDALARIAALHGIERFTADVLSDNQLMLSVFRDAGFRIEADTCFGVTHIEFPIINLLPGHSDRPPKITQLVSENPRPQFQKNSLDPTKAVPGL
jgi:GNAT superfamily N-acetyltransferase